MIAVPFLVVTKILADHVEGMNALSQFLSARHISPLTEEELPPPAGTAHEVTTEDIVESGREAADGRKPQAAE